MSVDYTGPSEELILSSIQQTVDSWTANRGITSVKIEHVRVSNATEHTAHILDPSPDDRSAHLDEQRTWTYRVTHPDNCRCTSTFPTEAGRPPSEPRAT